MRQATRFARLIPLLLVVAGIAGCSVGRHEVPEVTDLPVEYTATGREVLSERWWLDLDDPSLDALIVEGLAGSPDLAIWWDRLDQARALARKAGADLWPAVGLDADAARFGQRGDSVPESYGSSFSLGAAASYELDLWGRIRSTTDAAVLDARASEEDVRAAALSLSAQIAATWYEVAEARSQIRLLEEQVETNRLVLEIITLSFRSGQVGAADVLRQRQLVEARRGDLELAESRLQVLRNQLAVLVGRAPQEPVADDDATLIELPPLPETGVPSELLQRRPDLRAAQLDLAAASARVGAAVADRYPRINLSAGISTGGSGTANIFTDWFGTLAAGLTAPLLDGGRRKAEVERQEALLAQAFDSYRLAVLTALKEVENALVQESRQRAYLQSLTSQLALADSVLERSRDDYLGGQTDYLRILESLTSQQSLQRQHLIASRALVGYRIDLCRALGGSWNLQRPGETAAASDEGTQS